MNTEKRVLLAVLGVLGVSLTGASLAWACYLPGTGVPSSPSQAEDPPPPQPPSGGGDTGAGGGAGSGSGSGGQAPSTGSAPGSGAGSSGGGVGGGGSSGSGSTSGGGSGGSGRGDPGRRGSDAGGPAGGDAVSSPQALFAARRRGETAGVSRSDGRVVFAKSAKAKRAGKATAAAPSEKSAGGDLWGAFAGAKRSSLPVTAEPSTGGDTGLTASIAILGIGLMGMLGTLALAAARRRRAEAGRQAGSEPAREI